MTSHDPRDHGLQIPPAWYQSPKWRIEMQANAKATLAVDVSWVERKFKEYEARGGQVTVDCHYCQKPCVLITGADLYPQKPSLSRKLFWKCQICGAYVGCHPGTDKPLGITANRTLRIAKMELHGVFDQFWKCGYMTRQKAYAMLSEAMGIPPEKTHIGMFDIKTCRKAISICLGKLSALEKNHD